VAYRIPENAETQGRIFDLAIEDKRAREENIAGDLGFERGSPVKRPSERFAGDLIAGNLGLNGPFGSLVNNQDDPESQKRIGSWAQYWANGPFGPDSGYA